MMMKKLMMTVRAPLPISLYSPYPSTKYCGPNLPTPSSKLLSMKTSDAHYPSHSISTLITTPIKILTLCQCPTLKCGELARVQPPKENVSKNEQSHSVINMISNTRAPTEAFMRRNISQSSNLYSTDTSSRLLSPDKKKH
ncbi:hypothetical protein Peur_059818 [Populus x canadensis]